MGKITTFPDFKDQTPDITEKETCTYTHPNPCDWLYWCTKTLWFTITNKQKKNHILTVYKSQPIEKFKQSMSISSLDVSWLFEWSTFPHAKRSLRSNPIFPLSQRCWFQWPSITDEQVGPHGRSYLGSLRQSAHF